MEEKTVPTVVIVDDEELITISLKALFTVETSYRILTFNSSQQALEALQHETVDLIISDFLMPHMDGIQFLIEAKKLYPEVTSLLLTGYADKENAIKAINEAGIYRYIEKPWDTDELLLAVKNGIERSKLITRLQQTVIELDEKNTALTNAKEELEVYSTQLESKVEERTHELHLANVNLISLNQKLEAIIHSSLDGIMTLDHYGTITSCNQAVEKMLPAFLPLAGKQLSTCLTYDTKLIPSLFTGNPLVIPQCTLLNGADKIPVTLSISPMIRPEEATYNGDTYVAVIHDVTYQKENEQLREEFIATLTHDLRTPLHANIQSINILLEGMLGNISEKQEKLLQTLKTSNHDLLNLVNTILDVYKYEADVNLNIYKEQTDLQALIIQCVEEYKLFAEKKGTQLHHQIEGNSLPVLADKQEIKRVLCNLIGNAILYTPHGTTVNIIAKREDKYVKIEVQDDGNGLTEEDQVKLFQRFSQGINKSMSIGTGLGLYLSKQIVENHEGYMGVISQKGQGCTFYFTLPCVF